MIELVVVEYSSCSKEICYAPAYSIKAGDKVVTDFGTGIVTDVINVWDGSEAFVFFKKNLPIEPVTAVITALKYEVDE